MKTLKTLNDTITDLEGQIILALRVRDVLLQRADELDASATTAEQFGVLRYPLLRQMAEAYRVHASRIKREIDRSKRLIQQVKLQQNAAWN